MAKSFSSFFFIYRTFTFYTCLKASFEFKIPKLSNLKTIGKI